MATPYCCLFPFLLSVCCVVLPLYVCGLEAMLVPPPSASSVIVHDCDGLEVLLLFCLISVNYACLAVLILRVGLSPSASATRGGA